MTARDYLTRALSGNLFETIDFPENMIVIMQPTSNQLVHKLPFTYFNSVKLGIC